MSLLATNLETPVRLATCTRSSSPEEYYRLLIAIRRFEESLLETFTQGLLSGTTHTCLGQETTAVGVVSAIDRDRDIVFSNHRGHGHFLAYCGEIERLYLEILGNGGGLCGGRGGSQHLHRGNFYSNGIQGGIVPVATGMAMAEKRRGSAAIVVVFLGDGTLGEGVVYESFNMASLWRLPILFVIEHNRYAQSTPSHLQIAGSVRSRLQAFGIPTDEVDGKDLRAVLDGAGYASETARHGAGPRGLILRTDRLGPHSKGDDTRDPQELASIWACDPLKQARASIGSDSMASEIERQALALVTAARTRALARAHDA